MAAACWSVLVNGAGYVVPWGCWCNHPDVDRCPARLWDWRDSPWAAAFLGFGSGKDEGVTTASRWDLTVTHALGKNFQIRGGFGYLTAHSAREDADKNIAKSPIRATAAGVVLGIDFVF